VAGLVDVEPGPARQVVEQFLTGLLQGGANLADDLGQLAAREGKPLLELLRVRGTTPTNDYSGQRCRVSRFP
jgi:hypothetical protein